MKNTGKKTAVVLIVCALLLASCGMSKNSETAFVSKNNAGIQGVQSNKGYYASDSVSYDNSYDSYDASEEYAGEYYEDNVGGNYVSAEGAETNDTKKTSVNAEKLKNEMLIYSCTMNVDVLDFDTAVNNLKLSMKQYDAFVEMENFSDGRSTSRWYDEKAQKWNTYTATIRVPSRVYDDFCDAVSGLGDLRKKNASVQNVSTEYHDLSTTLEIYEKKEERYLSLLAEIKDEQYALDIEDKLTQIQIEIAKLKTRMNKIDTDVAYSYVYVTLNEVKEYQQEPAKEDTFFDRLSNTLKDAGEQFLDFLEGLLFALIYLFPYALLMGVGVFVLAKFIKALKKGKEKRRAKKAGITADKTAENENNKTGADEKDKAETEK